ncbi:MAG: MFS transporter [Sphingobacteriales bacterium]|nr:MAG: MFS transporter [Sphingobacteriales bacterium]
MPSYICCAIAMSTTPHTVPQPQGPRSISSSLTMLMAVTCGLVVANIYYNQPLLAEIGRSFNVPDSTVSLLATVTQVGYTIGLLFAVPLGDKLERKKLILSMLGIAFISMLGASVAPNFELMLIAGLFTGIFSAVPQILLPMAAHQPASQLITEVMQASCARS